MQMINDIILEITIDNARYMGIILFETNINNIADNNIEDKFMALICISFLL